ncbi:MAG: DUF2235 domain-containing protein [Pseudomonadota bacterium]|nr:DUF2235 domain-containing protein [Pseudomonadota bacterium]
MAKRLVICSDGTWNIPDRKDRGRVCPSNVAKMALAVAPRDPQGVEQQVFYNKGVGTGAFDRLRGGAFGWGLSKNIQDVYRFIVERYELGDEIFLFGFSRGAYTVRSAAGLIRNCGVLKREHKGKVVEAYNLYRRRDDASHPTGVEAQLFRRQFSTEVRIRFIGVWDTVGALGIPVGIPWLPVSWLHFINKRWEFHDVKLSTFVDNAYHALAIDEKRPQFTPTLWEQQPDAQSQHMEQVWFAGVHTNVGGGYQDTGLSDITFLWMKEKAEACGLAFDQEYIQQAFAPDHLGVLRDSKTGLYELFPDAVRPIGRGHRANEVVHPSAVDRMEQARNPSYRPTNLVSYLQRGGKVTPP